MCHQPEWADLSRLPRQYLNLNLVDRIRWSLELYPCDMLYVHRDAEKQPHEVRVAEIKQAVEKATISEEKPVVCVIPVRMQEAWLLFDEQALRFASGNPNGQHPLQLPPLATLEQLPNPKEVLYNLLREASRLYGRRRRKLLASKLARRVAEFVADFSPLRNLPAFSALETEVEEVVKVHGWNAPLITD